MAEVDFNGEMYEMIDNELYYDDVKYVANLELPWEKIKDSTVMITGASGLIGSALIDSIMYRNLHNEMNCTIFAIGRNVEKAKQRFFGYWDNDCFNFIVHDINLPLDDIFPNKIDYIIHLASNTHPVAYATEPIGTVTANICLLYTSPSPRD